jgi:hypothetical protein
MTRSWLPRATAANTLTFYGFRIDVRRVGGRFWLDISLKLRATRFRDQHASSKPCRCLASAHCGIEFLAGCVSPIDARYASPETGQIS